MTDRPILFSRPMVRALLSGLKTQTRRTMKPQPSSLKALGPSGELLPYKRVAPPDDMSNATMEVPISCPYGAPGDRLWVKETFKPHSTFAHLKPSEIPDSKIFYRADNSYAPNNTKWWPSLFMQRRFSRILLEVVNVRAERLNDCSDADALAEGVREPSLGAWVDVGLGQVPRDRCGAVAAYAALWEIINGPGSWTANPWVWVVEFKRIQP